jgi:hypothetical protein
MWKRWVGLFLGVLVLAGCAAPRLSPQDDAKIARVGILVLVPEQLAYDKLALTVFGNETSTFDVGDRVNEAIRTTAATRLSAARPAWQIKQIRRDRERLVERLRVRSLVMSNELERIEVDLAQLAKDEDVNILLVFKETNYDRLGGAGVGVMERSQLVGGPLTLLQGNLGAYLVDGAGRIGAAANMGFDMDFWRIDGSEFGLSRPLSAQAAATLAAQLERLVIVNTNKRMTQLGY